MCKCANEVAERKTRLTLVKRHSQNTSSVLLDPHICTFAHFSHLHICTFAHLHIQSTTLRFFTVNDSALPAMAAKPPTSPPTTAVTSSSRNSFPCKGKISATFLE